MTTFSTLIEIPENTSFLQPTKFTFTFPNLPFLRYFCQTVIVPGLSTSPVGIETPFSATYRHGDKLTYEPLTVTALIDEDMRVWEETYKWIVSLTFPSKFPEYVKYTDKTTSPYHDGLLTINNNANLPNIRIKYFEAHPISLGPVNFNTTQNADTPLTAEIQFRYDRFEIERI